ncbi:universal stress protein [Flavobacteriaceae bacterium 3-367]
MQNILVLTDFSNSAYSALFYATQLLRSKDCTFYLLNTFNETTPLRTKRIAKREGRALLAQLGDESQEGLQYCCHRIVLDNDNPRHSFLTISKNSGLVETASRTVAEMDIDLVVMGNKGMTNAKATFWGSNTTKIINGLRSCPILTVPKEMDFVSPKEIAFATDYKHSFCAEQLEPLRFLANLFKSSVRIMHVNEEKKLDKYQESNCDTLCKYLSAIDCTMHWMPYFGSKAEAIGLFVKELDVDMLAMLSYQHGFLEKLLREPVIKRVNFDLEVPFLVVPCQD